MITTATNPRRTSSRGRTPSGKPNPIDIHIGARIRLIRTLKGMTQEALAAALDLTFQQVQKYERGANRVGGSRLFDLSRVLDVPVGFFFDDMADTVSAASPARIGALAAGDIPDLERDPMLRRETLELSRAYHRIADAAVRRKAYDLVKALADITPTHAAE